MELRDYLSILRKHWSTIVGLSLMVLALAAAWTLTSTPQYTASTRLFFAVQGNESVSDLMQGSYFAEAQMASYAAVATSPLVLDPVREGLGLAPDAVLDVSATVPINTVILEVTATDPDPVVAASVADAVGAQVADAVGTLSPPRPDGTEAVLATTLTPAEVPSSPSSPNTSRNLALGLILGLMVGIGAALLKEVLDTKVRSEADLQGVTETSVIGSIVFDPSAPQHPIVMQDDPNGARAEAVRRLRTNLQFVEIASDRHTILVTSSIPGEGKTTTAVNLAVALADAGQRVLLIDADLRRPSVAKAFGLEGNVGLTTVLIGRAKLADVVQPWNRTTLDVLAAGQVPPNPSELLGSQTMATLLERVEAAYDIVLIDSPPLLPVTDATVLSKIAGGTLVVIGSDHTHKAQLGAALDTLETVGAHVIGLVLNKIPQRERSGYGYGYGYGPDQGVSEGAGRGRIRRDKSPKRRNRPVPVVPSKDKSTHSASGGEEARREGGTREPAGATSRPSGTWPGEPLSRYVGDPNGVGERPRRQTSTEGR